MMSIHGCTFTIKLGNKISNKLKILNIIFLPKDKKMKTRTVVSLLKSINFDVTLLDLQIYKEYFYSIKDKNLEFETSSQRSCQNYRKSWQLTSDNHIVSEKNRILPIMIKLFFSSCYEHPIYGNNLNNQKILNRFSSFSGFYNGLVIQKDDKGLEYARFVSCNGVLYDEIIYFNSCYIVADKFVSGPSHKRVTLNKVADFHSKEDSVLKDTIEKNCISLDQESVDKALVKEWPGFN